MTNNVIQTGNKIELRAITSKRYAEASSAQPEVYLSQFLKWSDHNTAVIALPFHKGKLIALRENETYNLRFFTKGGLYCCKATVVRRRKSSNNIPVAEIKFISPLEKFQRRQFFRMGCLLSIKYSVLNEEQREFYKERKQYILERENLILEEKLAHENIKFLKGTVLDISGGGIRFSSREAQNVGDILLLCIEFPDELLEKIPFLIGRVILSEEVLGKDTFDNRVEFIDISNDEQERIVTYIFKEEREKRKKNL